MIDANKRHDDDPNSIIKQEIKEEPGMDFADGPGMDFMDDPSMMELGGNDMLPVYKDEDFPNDMNYPLDPSMDPFGMGGGSGSFGAGYNSHIATDFGSLGSGSSVGNLHGPSGQASRPAGLGIAGFAKESQFGGPSSPKFGHTPANMTQHTVETKEDKLVESGETENPEQFE